MKKLKQRPALLVVLGILSLNTTACADLHEEATRTFSSHRLSDSTRVQDIEDLEQILNRAEARATPEGRAILQKGRAMIAAEEIIVGSCWDYIQAVYNHAGYPEKKRINAFKGKKAGPYADVNDLQPGDWLYYINHSYGDIEHSGIFVDWSDFGAREAVILSYPGESRQVPGRYKVYDLNNVYNIIRAR